MEENIKESLVSVIVPVYNGALFLKDCIDSIVSQDYSHIEIILVDDDSEDNSLDLCNQLSVKHSNISVIHQTHAGLSAARNNGIKHSAGNYIMFIDCDDRLENMDLISGNMALFNKETDWIQYPIRKIFLDKNTSEVLCNQTGYIDSEQKYLENVLPLYRSTPINRSVCNKIFKRIIFDHVLFREGLLHEDSYFMLDICHYFYHGRLGNTGFYDYYIRSNGSINTSKRSFKWYSDYINMQLRYYQESKRMHLYENISLYNYLTIIGTLRVTHKDLKADDISDLISRVVSVAPSFREICRFAKIDHFQSVKLFFAHIIGLKTFLKLVRRL